MPFKQPFTLSVWIWFWFAYLPILVRILPHFRKGVWRDWVERDRPWWTFCLWVFVFGCSTVFSKRQLLFFLRIADPLWKWLSLSLGLNPSHWERELAIVYKGLWLAIAAPERSMGESMFNKLWVRSSETSCEQRAWSKAPRTKRNSRTYRDTGRQKRKKKKKRIEKEKLKEWKQKQESSSCHCRDCKPYSFPFTSPWK